MVFGTCNCWNPRSPNHQAQFDGNYLHEDLFDMAGAYLVHIVCNHPFLDGNKRTGFIAAAVFLAINGLKPIAPTHIVYEMTIAVAEGRLPKRQIAENLRALVQD